MSDYLAHHHATPLGSAWPRHPSPPAPARGYDAPTGAVLGCVTGSSVATGAVIAGAGWPAVVAAGLVAAVVACLCAAALTALHRAQAVIGGAAVQPPRSYVRSQAGYAYAVHGLAHGGVRHD